VSTIKQLCGEITGDLKTDREESLTKRGVRISICKECKK